MNISNAVWIVHPLQGKLSLWLAGDPEEQILNCQSWKRRRMAEEIDSFTVPLTVTQSAKMFIQSKRSGRVLCDADWRSRCVEAAVVGERDAVQALWVRPWSWCCPPGPSCPPGTLFYWPPIWTRPASRAQCWPPASFPQLGRNKTSGPTAITAACSG